MEERENGWVGPKRGVSGQIEQWEQSGLLDGASR